ncbi:MAG: dockerin type I repeat-containing protein, partial [Clostridia bacterium]|nr:dockerin type I repeat-containing protein [Clostridia bacterium]
MKTSIVIKKAIAFLTCLFMLCGVLSVNAEQTVTTVTQHTLPYYFGAITPSKIISGDINGDYFVNNKDLSRILQYLCGWDDIIYVEETLDVNGDNTVNSKDLIRLFKYLSGYDVQIFPLCEHTGGKATCHSKAKCELCGKEYGEFDATNHSGETEIRDSVDPTCTETGYTGNTYCLGCGVKLANGTEIAALGHSFTNYVSDANETCTDDGTKTAKCDRCSATDTVLNAGSRLGHDFGEWSVTTPATCTEKGVETRICKRDASHTETRETPPLGHTGGKATCTAKAVCTRCNGEYGEIDPYYHPNANAQGAKEPTCTEVGHTGVFTCPDCHLVMSEDEVIPARGHSFTDYYSDNNVSCTQGGTKTARCIYCNLADTVADPDAPALGHDYNAVVTAPTCTQTGYTRYTCLRCKDSYVDSDTAALGHDYQAFVTAPTCTKQGYTTHACSRCDDSYVDNYTDAIGHNYQAFVTAPTCTKQGYTTHTCSRCNESYVDNYKMIGYTGTATYYEKAICNVCGKAHYTQMLAYDSLNQNQKDMYDYLNEKIAGFTRGYIYVFDYVEYVKNNPTRAESDI